MDFGLIPKVDEDKGSPLRNGVNLPQPCPPPKGEDARRGRKNRTISGSPSGRPYPSFFPSKKNFAYNNTRVIARSKGNGWQKVKSEKAIR